MWSGLNMIGFGILIKIIVWMICPLICNIAFVYKITKWLLNGLERTISHQSIHLRLMLFSENLVDAVRAARSNFIVEQYNIPLGKRFSYT